MKNIITFVVELKISMKKEAILIFFTVLLLPFFVFSQNSLEISYPQIGGFAPTVQTPLHSYVKYIFDFTLRVVVIIALVFFVKAGFQYLSSAGDPKKQSDAKKQILACFSAMIILFFSYLLLRTIRGEFVNLSVNEPEEVAPGPPPEDLPPEGNPDPLARMRDLVTLSRQAVNQLIQTADNLNNVFQECKCENSISECDCVDLECLAIRCLGDPCPREKLKEKQKLLIEASDLVLAYKNRIDSEREDLGPELDHLIFLKRITKTEKEEILNALAILSQKMTELATTAQELAKMPADCAPENCQAQCKESSCHDTEGCHPEKCKGEACPEIKNKFQQLLTKIKNLQSTICPLCQKIVGLLSK